MITIALDAGHGQDSRRDGVYDPGAVEGREQEAERAFQIVESVLFVAASEYAGKVKLVLTRDSRVESSPLGGRDEEAEREGAQYLLSIHLNAGGGTGTETYYRDDRDKRFANIVQAAAVGAYGLRDRGVKSETETRHKRLAILNFDGPACLWEAGFIDNASDMARLFGEGSRAKRMAFCRGVLDGILATSARSEK